MRQKVFIFFLVAAALSGCKPNESEFSRPTIELFTGNNLTQNNEEVAVGGKLSFAFRANGEDYPLTNIIVQRIADGDTITEVDKGIFVEDIDFEDEVNAVKSNAEVEVWKFIAMNANRDTASVSLNVQLGEGVDYGPIKHFESVFIGMQDNTQYPNFLDVNSGIAYSNESVAGNEHMVDVLAFVYLTSGVMSPTLNCPQYTTAPTYYPDVANWEIRNSTLYDYNATDNDLVNLDEFLAAANDSLLVNSFKPGSSSGNCKFCFTGKLVPFKTQEGKFGIIRVKHADTETDGYMELEIKVQE